MQIIVYCLRCFLYSHRGMEPEVVQVNKITQQNTECYFTGNWKTQQNIDRKVNTLSSFPLFQCRISSTDSDVYYRDALHTICARVWSCIKNFYSFNEASAIFLTATCSVFCERIDRYLQIWRQRIIVVDSAILIHQYTDLVFKINSQHLIAVSYADLYA